MGLLDRLFSPRRANPPPDTGDLNGKESKTTVVGATSDDDIVKVQTFSDDNITYQGDLTGYDYTAILKDKQGKIYDLYKLSDYFIDADPIYKGIIKHVYVPFSMLAKWKLIGSDQKAKDKYREYYKRIRLTKKLRSIYLQYYKYGNVFIYLMENGDLVTLPVGRCKITNVALNGEPLVQYDLQGLKDGFSGFGSKDQKYFKDAEFKKQLLGYPIEVGKALVAGDESVQLNPENTFVLQDLKEDWHRYAIPMIASFLPPLGKKALIGKYEDALLNLGMRTFVHVQYGDQNSKTDILPNMTQLRQVRNVFSQAMNGAPLAVTNHLAKAEVIQGDTRFLHEWDKYKEVNNDLLSAGGISGIVVTGVSNDGSTFSSAQVSMKAATARMEQMLSLMSELMTKINARIYQQVVGKKSGEPPAFEFMPLDLDGYKSMQEAGLTLWREGVLSTRTNLENFGYDLEEEVLRRKKESESGVDEVLVDRDYRQDQTLEDKDNPDLKTKKPKDGKETRGRDTLPDDERNSPPEDAQRGKQPKPSNPEGSTDNM